MTTIEQRIETAVSSVEVGAKSVEAGAASVKAIAASAGVVSSALSKFTSGPAVEVFVDGRIVKSLSLIESEIGGFFENLRQFVDSMDQETVLIDGKAIIPLSELERIAKEKTLGIDDLVQAELSKISQFDKGVWLANTTFNERVVFELDGLSYIPDAIPYTSAVTYQADIDAGKLVFLRGVVRSELGSSAFKESGYSSNDIVNNGQIDFVFGSLTEFDSVSRFVGDGQAVTLRSRYSRAECAVKGIEYPDRGGANYIFSTASGLIGNYGRTLQVDGGCLQLLPCFKYHISMWGVVDDLVDSSAKIQQCHDYLKSIDVSVCSAVGVKALCENITNFGNVQFEGGELLSRPDVMKGNSSVITPSFSDINPENHLRSFSVANEPVVVLVGDSTATPFANALDYSSTLSGLLERKLRLENPLKNVKFYNRAIGGQTWSTLASGPGYTAPYVVTDQIESWYTDVNKDWLDYVEELKPDLIIFHFGMNDAGNINVLHVRSILEGVKSWEGNPDVVLGTNLVPQSDNDAHSFGEFDQQNGRDIAAGYQRAVAESGGYGFLDFNRACNFLVRGQDHALSYSVETEVLGGDIAIAPTYVAKDWGCGYSLIAEAVVDSSFFGSSRNTALVFKLSGFKEYATGEFSNYLLVWRDSSSGNIKYNVVNRIVNGVDYFSTTDVDTGVLAPAGNLRFYFECNGSSVSLYTADIDGNRYDRTYLINNTVLCGGGWFQPEFGYRGDVSARPALWENVFVYVRSPLKTVPAINTNDAWGDAFKEGHTKSPTGGNGINHPTSKGASLIYGYVLDQISFASRPMVVGRYGRIGIGVSTPKASGLHVRKGESGVETVNTLAHQFVTEGENAVGHSLFMKTGGRASIVVTTPDNTAAAALQFNDGSKEWRLFIDNELVSSFKKNGAGELDWEPGLIAAGETKRQYFYLQGVSLDDVLDVVFDKMGTGTIGSTSNYLTITAQVIGQHAVYVYLKNGHTEAVTVPEGKLFIRARTIK